MGTNIMSYRAATASVAMLSAFGCEHGGSPRPEPRRIETGGSVAPIAIPTSTTQATSTSAQSSGAVAVASEPDEDNGKPALLSARQIAAITDDANAAEIEQAELAQKRGQDPRV